MHIYIRSLLMTKSVSLFQLPSDFSWQKLKDMCRHYGDIKFAEIRCKGTGLVRFGSENEARRAAGKVQMYLRTISQFFFFIIIFLHIIMHWTKRTLHLGHSNLPCMLFYVSCA